ncbi:SRPBCC family protein [Usitatibacter palustris]|uniref:Polyketide cyclase / dehydrase and lipid transport n=1 Tax=Usitatibacter palustris TaxID=2732487 RepID=A0A6M4HB19_9PROT|nr:SRPBCC family protein [Usitatibacter palustris]QJR15833.1 hypothetical protein DSM104440_02659 [Usitatibacter palustris]
MKILKWILIIVVGLVAVFLAVGLMLPSTFRVEREASIKAPADKVYALVADPREWKKWSAWNERDPNMKIVYSGPESGKGAKWSWVSKTEGDGSMEFTNAEPGKVVEFALHFPDMDMSSKGAMKFVGQGNTTMVYWHNEGDVGKNPLARYFALVMDKLVGPDFEKGLANLKKVAEAP